MHLLLLPGHLGYKQNDRKVKGKYISKKKEGKRESLLQKYSAGKNHHRSVAEKKYGKINI